MKDWGAKETKSTRVYLKMGHYILKAYTEGEKDLTVQQRAMFAWVPVSFLRYWKGCLSISGFEIESNFVTLQTCDDFILSVIILRYYFIYYYVYEDVFYDLSKTYGRLAQTAVRNCSQCWIYSREIRLMFHGHG